MSLNKNKLATMTNFIDTINNNFNQLPPLIIQNTFPSLKSEAQVVGQKWFNTETGGLYICSNIEYDNENKVKNLNTKYYWNQVSGKGIYNTIVNSINPTTSTHSDGIGQLYINSYNNNLYICSSISIDGAIFTWTLIAKGNIFPIIVITNGIIKNNIAKGVGQLMLDVTNNNLYMCVNREKEDDIWCPINTNSQQIFYSSGEPVAKIEDSLWFHKKAGYIKNTDGETTPLPIIL